MEVVNESTTPSVEGRQRKSQGPTLKLLQNKTHIGPVSEGKAVKANLSKAAGKIMFDSNLKVTIKTTGEDVLQKDPLKVPQVKEIKLSSSNFATEGFLYMMAWDKIYQGIGTKAYQEKYQAFVVRQAQVYEEIGIHLNPNSPKPQLTEQQRRMYNDKMRSFAFSYYEYRLSFKQPHKKAVKSLTFRTLKPQDFDRMISNLTEHTRRIHEKVEIRPSQRNN